MGKGKRKKKAFSEEERELIQILKQQLSATDVPRNQWSYLIQQELDLRRQSRKTPGIPKGKLGKVLKKPLDKVQGAFQKFATKRMAKGFGDFSGMFGESSGELREEEVELMDAMFPGMGLGGTRVDNESLGKHGTFVSERPDKKRKIVDLGDFDNEE